MSAIMMPALSPTMEKGTLAKWLVRAGDSLKAGDVIAEIETDKATMELEAADDGIVAEILVVDGTEDIAVGAPILRLAAEGETVTAPITQEPVAAPQTAPSPEPIVVPQAAQMHLPATPNPARHVDATALGHKLAQVRRVDLAALAAEQSGARITLADVARATDLVLSPPPPPALPVSSATIIAPPAPLPLPFPAPEPGGVPYETERLSTMRKTIARRLTQSKQEIPHFYLTVDVVLDPLLGLRAELNEALADEGGKLSVNDMILKAQALALLHVPDANVSFSAEGIRRHTQADISVAVALPGGLITPVIRNASAKSLSAIAAEMKDLASRAPEGRFQPGEYSGGTASLSNLGMFGIKQFDAVINPPEGMILAIGAGERRPHVSGDTLGMATVMSATGSFDHRAIDGAAGAAFMAAFKTLVENPWRILA
jgi:pyruvate dehydrogenase E2 component (dihydrolipoamide acetyltransferase)